jgi:hypothetical protein
MITPPQTGREESSSRTVEVDIIEQRNKLTEARAHTLSEDKIVIIK